MICGLSKFIYIYLCNVFLDIPQVEVSNSYGQDIRILVALCQQNWYASFLLKIGTFFKENHGMTD